MQGWGSTNLCATSMNIIDYDNDNDNKAVSTFNKTSTWLGTCLNLTKTKTNKQNNNKHSKHNTRDTLENISINRAVLVNSSALLFPRVFRENKILANV